MNSGTLRPPQRLEIGSIVTLRMRGHSRTEGKEYFAPAIVLDQHQPNGEIEALVFDPTAGTHYNPSYQIRDISSRGEGATRELYEVQSNIGQVLFSPETFEQVQQAVAELQAQVLDLSQTMDKLNQCVCALQPPVALPTEAGVPLGPVKKRS
jgi:hypothetical protein